MALPLSFPVVARSLAAPRVGVFALELELFVLLGAASCVLRLGLPLFLLYDDKQAEWGGEKRVINIQMSPEREHWNYGKPGCIDSVSLSFSL